MNYNKFLRQKFEDRFGRFTTLQNKVVFAGNSKYPVGTKVKFKDDGKYYTGTLTHTFGFCGDRMDVGVWVDQKGVFSDNAVCLKNREYEVIDEDVKDFLYQYNMKETGEKYNL